MENKDDAAMVCFYMEKEIKRPAVFCEMISADRGHG